MNLECGRGGYKGVQQRVGALINGVCCYVQRGAHCFAARSVWVSRDRDATLMGALCSLLEAWMAAWPEEDDGEGRGKVFNHSMHN